MKICIVLFVAAFAFVAIMKLTGCKTKIDVDKMNRIFYYGGTTVSYVLNPSSIDSGKRVVIYDIFKDIKTCTPEVGQPIGAKWTEIAQDHVDSLVKDGTIDAGAGVLIMSGFNTAMAGVNFLENRYPEIRNDRDLLCACVSGFCDGFLDHFIVDNNIAKIAEKNSDRGLVMIDSAVYDVVYKAAAENNLK